MDKGFTKQESNGSPKTRWAMGGEELTSGEARRKIKDLLKSRKANKTWEVNARNDEED